MTPVARSSTQVMHDAVRTTSTHIESEDRDGGSGYAGEYRRIGSEAEPTHRHGLPEQRVQREPDGQVENDHDDGGRYSGERACELLPRSFSMYGRPKKIQRSTA
jgi:hypothetical protein